jgi:hypothetical protein
MAETFVTNPTLAGVEREQSPFGRNQAFPPGWDIITQDNAAEDNPPPEAFNLTPSGSRFHVAYRQFERAGYLQRNISLPAGRYVLAARIARQTAGPIPDLGWGFEITHEGQRYSHTGADARFARNSEGEESLAVIQVVGPEPVIIDFGLMFDSLWKSNDGFVDVLRVTIEKVAPSYGAPALILKKNAAPTPALDPDPLPEPTPNPLPDPDPEPEPDENPQITVTILWRGNLMGTLGIYNIGSMTEAASMLRLLANALADGLQGH